MWMFPNWRWTTPSNQAKTLRSENGASFAFVGQSRRVFPSCPERFFDFDSSWPVELGADEITSRSAEWCPSPGLLIESVIVLSSSEHTTRVVARGGLHHCGLLSNTIYSLVFS